MSRSAISVDSALISKYKAFAKKVGMEVKDLVDISLERHYRFALASRKNATRIVIKAKGKKPAPKKVKATKKTKAKKVAAKPKLRAVA